jgi:CheY-like chemotaxis protein
MAQKSYKILIVDDDKAFLTMITAILMSMQSHLVIETARSGKECLQKVKIFSPNLVFLDIGMDGMNGLVTLRFIKSMDKKAVVFFLSGHSVEYLKEAVGMVHVDGYFTKTQFLEILKNKESLEDILNEGKANT